MTSYAQRSAPHSDDVRRLLPFSGASVRRAQRSVSSVASRRIHSDARRLMTSYAQRSAPHSDYCWRREGDSNPRKGFPFT